MTIKNWLHNKLHGIRKIKDTHRCKNCGAMRTSSGRGSFEVIVKYDWNKPMKFTTKTFSL